MGFVSSWRNSSFKLNFRIFIRISFQYFHDYLEVEIGIKFLPLFYDINSLFALPTLIKFYSYQNPGNIFIK